MIRLLFMKVIVILILFSLSGMAAATCSMNYDNAVVENSKLSVSQNSNTQYLHDIAYYADDTTGIPYDNSEMLDYNENVIYFSECEDWLDQYGGDLDHKEHASNCSCLGDHWGNNSDYAKYSIGMSEDTDNLFFKIRYSDEFDSNNDANILRIYLDEELKGELFTKDTYDWDEFLWSDQIDMGCISAGTHELNITSGNGGEWNCVNLDCFKLIDDWKNEWTGKNSESGAIITTSELQDAIHHWLDDIPVRGHIMSTADLQEIIVIWLSH
ncbi:MAG: hypothetical protein KAJ93_07605 [Methanosarcinales archaeon]|nr:hypothetical protein [Methanosarcinales archaeon]